MFSQNKTFRYYYWLTLEFIKKHSKLIFLSSLISTIAMISVITISPYIINTAVAMKTVIIGMTGSYSYKTLPEEIKMKISNGMLYINEKGVVMPLLASSWEQLDNGLTYRMHLRMNLVWNDGTPFTVKDIDYTFKDIQVIKNGEYQMEFKLTKPLAIFPIYLTQPIIKYPDIGVGGLYKISRLKKRDDLITEIVLEPNKKDLSPLVYKFYSSETDLINAYKRAEINQMIINRKSVADTFLHWKNSDVVKSVDYSNLMTLFFNFCNPALKEKEFRNAIEMGLNKTLFQDLGVEADSSIPPTSWAYNPDLKRNQYDFDLAKKILSKSKIATDSVKLNLITYYDYIDVADDIVRNLNDLGLDTAMNFASVSNLSSFDFLLAYMKIPNDPDQYYYWHSTQEQGNISGYKNLRVDKALEDARSTAVLDERKKAYKEMQKIMNDDKPALFLYFPYVYTIKRK